MLPQSDLRALPDPVPIPSDFQNVGALLDASLGWGVYGRPSRVSDLEKALSKHMVVRLSNATTTIDICVVHLRRPLGNGGAASWWSRIVLCCAGPCGNWPRIPRLTW
jgi:hypothetical protein